MDRESAREPLNTLLEKWRDGDRAAGQEVIALAYKELRRLAAYFFRHEGAGHTLQPTALVNEVFLKLSSGAPVSVKDRTHFFAMAAKQMRRVLIDHARRRQALKRNDTEMQFPLSAEDGQHGSRFEKILNVEEALQDLEALDPRAARVVELRVWGGLTELEIAGALDISAATVKRDWTFAKAWLVTRLSE